MIVQEVLLVKNPMVNLEITLLRRTTVHQGLTLKRIKRALKERILHKEIAINLETILMKEVARVQVGRTTIVQDCTLMKIKGALQERILHKEMTIHSETILKKKVAGPQKALTVKNTRILPE